MHKNFNEHKVVNGVSFTIYKGEVLDDQDKKESDANDDVLKQIKKITANK